MTKAIKNLADIEAFERQNPLDERLPDTTYQLFATNAQRYGDSPALLFVQTGTRVERPVTIGYTKLLRYVTATANLFAHLAGAGSGVAILMPALIETQMSFWAAQASGFALPLNPLLDCDALEKLIRASGAKILVTCGEHYAPTIWDKAQQLRLRMPHLKVVRVDRPGTPAPQGVANLGEIAAHNPQQLCFSPPQRSSAVAAYFHTDGTAGDPLLVALTHRNLLASAYSMGAMIDLTPADTCANGIPHFHVMGAISCTLAALMHGARVLMLSPQGMKNPLMQENYWQIVQKYQVTICAATPAGFAATLNRPIANDLSSIRLGLAGGAPLPVQTAKQFFNQTGKHLHEMWGLTETAGAVSIDPAAELPTPGSAGYRMPYTSIRVRRKNATGAPEPEDCQPYKVGVLFVDGATLSPGYRISHNAALQPLQNARKEGFDTGDLAYHNRKGKLFLISREKDIIIRNRVLVAPSMLEDAFTAHPDVATAAAVSQPDPQTGEALACFLVLKPEAQNSVEAICSAAQAAISERTAWPKDVYVVRDLPATALGKICKHKLRLDAAYRHFRPLLEDGIGSDLVSLSITPHPTQKRGVHLQISTRSHHSIEVLNHLLAPYTQNHLVETSLHPNAPAAAHPHFWKESAPAGKKSPRPDGGMHTGFADIDIS